jgi:hypothetical protein
MWRALTCCQYLLLGPKWVISKVVPSWQSMDKYLGAGCSLFSDMSARSHVKRFSLGILTTLPGLPAAPFAPAYLYCQYKGTLLHHRRVCRAWQTPYWSEILVGWGFQLPDQPIFMSAHSVSRCSKTKGSHLRLLEGPRLLVHHYWEECQRLKRFQISNKGVRGNLTLSRFLLVRHCRGMMSVSEWFPKIEQDIMRLLRRSLRTHFVEFRVSTKFKLDRQSEHLLPGPCKPFAPSTMLLGFSQGFETLPMKLTCSRCTVQTVWIAVRFPEVLRTFSLKHTCTIYAVHAV